MKITHLTIAVLAVGVAVSSSAGAKTVVQSQTYVSPMPMEDARMIDFAAFDNNGDGILTMGEVGTELFYIFDRDGNEIIDNQEFGRDSLMTIAPMEQETFTFVDRAADGDVETVTYSYDQFLQASQLVKFTNNGAGLSPEEFIQASFLEIDDNDDHAVDLEEWKEAYLPQSQPESAEQDRYNN